MTDICRLCASLKTFEQLKFIDDPSLDLKKKLLRCCQINISHSNELLPQNVCSNCIQRIDSAWAFAEEVSLAQETLCKAFLIDEDHLTGENVKDEGVFCRSIAIKEHNSDCGPSFTHARRTEELSIKTRSIITSLYLKNQTADSIANRLKLNVNDVQRWIDTYNLQWEKSDRTKLAATTNIIENQELKSNFSADNENLENYNIQEYDEDEMAKLEIEEKPREVAEEFSNIEKSNNIRILDPTELEHVIFEGPAIDEDSSQCSLPAIAAVDDDEDDAGETELIPENNVGVITRTDGDTWTNMPWICNECNKEFRNVQQLSNHFKGRHTLKLLRYKCAFCPRVFNRYKVYLKHVRTSHKPHLNLCCDVCSKFCTDLKTLKEHSADHAIDVDTYLCQTCGKGYSKLTYLQAHTCCHITEKKQEFKCEICFKKFTLKTNLAAHIRIHSGIREFTCDQCGKSFVQKGNLDNHILTHSNLKPFSCEICNKSFKTALRLGKHSKIHTDVRPHNCDVCGREFREKGTLNEHMRIHTGSLPYECDFCGKRFRFKGILTTHRRTHTGERPYSCVECDHHFTNWPNYNKHMIRRHGINTCVTVRKPQTILPTGIPANAKQNYVVPTTQATMVIAETVTATATVGNPNNVPKSTENASFAYSSGSGETTSVIVGHESILNNGHQRHLDSMSIELRSSGMPSEEQIMTADEEHTANLMSSPYAYIPSTTNLMGGYYI